MIRSEIRFNCKIGNSEDHPTCTNVVVDSVSCHFGNLEKVREALISAAKATVESGVLASILPSIQVFREDPGVFEHSEYSEPRICFLLSQAFNLKKLLQLPEYTGVIVLPGTRDVIVIDASKLIPRLKDSYDSSFRFRPNSIKELRTLKLGEDTLREVTKLAFRTRLLSVSDQEIVTEE